MKQMIKMFGALAVAGMLVMTCGCEKKAAKKTEAPKAAETKKVEAPKAAEPKKAEAPKTEAPKVEEKKADAPKAESK